MIHHRSLQPVLVFLLALIASPAAAQGDGPVLKRSQKNGRTIEHRIDLGSVHKTWAYKTFWTSALDAQTKAPVMVQQSFWSRLRTDPADALTFRPVPWSQKFVIDCTGRRLGMRFIQSSDPKEAPDAVSLKAMTWQDLKNFPAMHAALCD